MNATDQRSELGKERVGAPASEIYQAICRLKGMEHYQQIRFDAVQFYCERFLFRELMGLMAGSLELDQLAALDPQDVKIVFILLLRDMMQTHRREIVIDPDEQRWDTARIEQFTAGLIYEAEAPTEPYINWLSEIKQGEIKDGEKEPSDKLITTLAEMISVDPKVLHVYQEAICNVVYEDVLSTQNPRGRGFFSQCWTAATQFTVSLCQLFRRSKPELRV